MYTIQNTEPTFPTESNNPIGTVQTVVCNSPEGED